MMRDTPTDTGCETKLWLIGFRIDPENTGPDFYTLIVPGEQDRPVLVDEGLAFFADPALAARVLDRAGAEVRRLGPPPVEPDLVCDLAEALYLIQSKDVDSSATILNSLNLLFDLVRETAIPMPPESRGVLEAFADFLTFERSFGPFIDQPTITRPAVTNALLWGLGAVMARVRIIK